MYKSGYVSEVILSLLFYLPDFSVSSSLISVQLIVLFPQLQHTSIVVAYFDKNTSTVVGNKKTIEPKT